MKISKEVEADINQLQMLEQNMQNLILQRQNFQVQLMEINNALKELSSTKEKPFKIVGNLMIETTKQDMEKDLNSKKEILDLKIKNFEKQESKIRERINDIQSKIMQAVNKKEGSEDG